MILTFNDPSSFDLTLNKLNEMRGYLKLKFP